MTPVVPTIEGLKGNSPTCSLATGSTLPQGVSLGSNCQFQGVSTSAGTYSGTVRLTVAGYDGEVTASYGFTVVAPRLEQSGGANPRVLGLGVTLNGSLNTSQVARLVYYNDHRTGDQTALTVSEGALPAGLSIELDDTGNVLIKGAPTEIGQADLKLTFTLLRAGHQVSTTLPLSFQVQVQQLTIDYSACCNAFTGVPMSFRPTTNYFAATGTAIQFQAHSGTLPAGLQLDPGTGEIFGIPSTSERNNLGFAVTASVTFNGVVVSQVQTSVFFWPVGVFGTYPVSSQGSIATYPSGATPPSSVSYHVTEGVPFSIAPGPLYGDQPGDAYQYRLVPNRNYSTPVPNWVSIDPATGVISGTKPGPSDSTTFEVEVNLTRGGGVFQVNQYWSIF